MTRFPPAVHSYFDPLRLLIFPLALVASETVSMDSHSDLVKVVVVLIFFCVCVDWQRGKHRMERVTRKIFFIFFSVFIRARSFEQCSLVRVRLY